VLVEVGGTAANTDYTLSVNGSAVTNTVVIPIGSKSTVVTVTAINNHIANVPNLNLTLTLDADTPYWLNGLKETAKVTILDAGA
jgi:hypothetical protein